MRKRRVLNLIHFHLRFLGIRHDQAVLDLDNAAVKRLHQIVLVSEKIATFNVAKSWTGAMVYAYVYTQYLPMDPDGIKYATDFPAATSEEREAIESKSTYSPTRFVSKTTVS